MLWLESTMEEFRDDMSAPVWDADLVTAAKGLHGEVERVVIHDSAGSTMREWTTTRLVTSVQSATPPLECLRLIGSLVMDADVEQTFILRFLNISRAQITT